MKVARPFEKYIQRVETSDSIPLQGRISRVQELLLESNGPPARVGEFCELLLPNGIVPAEVVGLRGRVVQLMPFASVRGITIDTPVVARETPIQIPVSQNLLGRVVDSLGHPIDGKGAIPAETRYSVMAESPSVLGRKQIQEQVYTGLRSIDSLISVGKGQRMGIFSGTGVGKSTLLGMIARNTSADVNVIALIGERAREVQEFINYDLGEAGLKKSVIVVSTSDSPPASRLKGAYTATTIAEYFRDKGLDVMLLFDSVTRFARAQREIGLSIGESPATRGYPPSTFSILPQLLERCGTSEQGTITGFYTILVDGDDLDEPISDNVRGILDGHIILSRRLAEQGQYPAIDIPASLSRLAPRITSSTVQKAARYIRQLISLYKENEDLISIGAYSAGADPLVDMAIQKNTAIKDFLQQEISEGSPFNDTLEQFFALASEPTPERAPEKMPQKISSTTGVAE